MTQFQYVEETLLANRPSASLQDYKVMKECLVVRSCSYRLCMLNADGTRIDRSGNVLSSDALWGKRGANPRPTAYP
jgi:hypothetical protein